MNNSREMLLFVRPCHIGGGYCPESVPFLTLGREMRQRCQASSSCRDFCVLTMRCLPFFFSGADDVLVNIRK